MTARLLGAATALLATGLAAVPGHAAAPKVPALAGTVQITGATAAGYLDVRVAKAMSYTDIALSTGTVPGNGFVTVALLKPGASATRAAGLVMQRIPGEDNWRMLGVGVSTQANVGLPAGNYRMFVIADAPTTATLTLKGQPRGLARLRTVKPAKGRNALLAVPAAGTNPLPAAEVHDTYTAGKEFVALAGAAFEFQVKHVMRIAGCTYETTPPAVTAGCAQGTRVDESDGLGSAQPQTTGLRVNYITSLYSSAGKTLTLGVDYATTGVLKRVVRWNTWIETS